MKFLLVLLLSACGASAFAGLGGAPTVPGPRILSSSATPATTAAASAPYTDMARTLDSGTQVHEYVNAAGVVFAVSWSGPFLPDLKEELGVHFQALLDAGKQPGASRSQVRLQQADLVIFSGGRMGAFEGRAWVPSLLPPGFNTADIK
jgi:hypothetical protein